MIQFLVHEKADNVGVATVEIPAGETAQGLYMDTQEPIEMKALHDIPLGHKIALKDFQVDESVIGLQQGGVGELGLLIFKGSLPLPHLSFLGQSHAQGSTPLPAVVKGQHQRSVLQAQQVNAGVGVGDWGGSGLQPGFSPVKRL